MEFTAQEIRESKAKALSQILLYLEASDVDGQFTDRNGSYYSKDKFLVTWNANWKGIPSEFGLDKTDSFYGSYSGYKCIYATRSLLHEKQLGGYVTIERGLIEVGMKLCRTKEDKINFFKKYGAPYNEKLKQLKLQHETK